MGRLILLIPYWESQSADPGEKTGPVRDIRQKAIESLKVLDPTPPNREEPVLSENPGSVRSENQQFKGHHFDREIIIIICVRRYLRFKLSFRDLVEMMAERGLSLAHTTIMRWIQRYERPETNPSNALCSGTSPILMR